MKRLNKSYFERPTLKVARDLLGTVLLTNIRGHRTSGMVVEVEAYCPDGDPASHSYPGRTSRNEVMFWQGGYCYVYLIYGMHYCVNVVTERENRGAAVLIRAVEPLDGLDTMRRRRRFLTTDLSLTNGPGKLCQAMGITDRLCGEHLLSSRAINLTRHKTFTSRQIGHSTRIGISKGKDFKWRFFIKDSKWLSR